MTEKLYVELNTLRHREEKIQKTAMKWKRQASQKGDKKKIEALNYLQERSRRAKKTLDDLMTTLGMARDRRAAIPMKSDGRVTRFSTLTRRQLQKLLLDYERVLSRSRNLGSGATTLIRRLFVDTGDRMRKMEGVLSPN